MCFFSLSVTAGEYQSHYKAKQKHLESVLGWKTAVTADTSKDFLNMHWTTIVPKSSGETIHEREDEVAMVLNYYT